MENKNYFDELYNLNVNGNVEKKNGLSYLSWAWAIAETLKKHPDMTYEILRFENNLPYTYDEKTGYMVFTKVTIQGITREMWLPVMDGANKAMLDHKYTYQTRYGEKEVEAATMFDINKTIMRCLTKNLAMFGLGLYIYAGEDLPEGENVGITIDEITEEIAKEYTITFGKHSGRKLIELIEEENGYIDWLLNNSKDEYLLKCIEVLSGQVPLSEDEQNEILDLIDKMMDLELKTNSDHEAILKHYKVKSNNDMTLEQLKDCISKLEKKLKGE